MNYLVDIYPWERPVCAGGEDGYEVGAQVVVGTEFGNDVGVVKSSGTDAEGEARCTILRRASERDIEMFQKNELKKKEIFTVCKQEVKRLKLEIKLVDVRLLLDGSGVIVVFTADGRVDFRELVKNLSRILRRGVRMQQIGSREEARKIGGCGVCGRELCCAKSDGSLPSITTDMARIQQISHRGSERISGLCGRLLCCLAYEAGQYRELMEGMPELHSFFETKEGKGEVIELNAIEQTVKLRLGNNQIITLKKEDLH